MNPNKLIAHRGDNTHYPENTLVAIESALKAGAVAFEFDVQMNADHSLVAFHDADFLRMTGSNKSKIFDLSDAQIGHLSIHEPEQFGEQHNPTRVSLVDEVIALLKRFPKAQAYVEIKEESLDFWGNDFVMKKLLSSLKGFEQQATIISFSASALAYTKTHSNLKIGLVFEEYSERIKSTATELLPEYLICSYQTLPEGNVWQGNWNWVVYTVNDLDLAKRLLKRGDIDLIETDDIQRLLNG